MEETFHTDAAFESFVESIKELSGLEVSDVLYAAIDVIYDDILKVEHAFEFYLKNKLPFEFLKDYSPVPFSHEGGNLLWLYTGNPEIDPETFVKTYKAVLGLKEGIYIHIILSINEFDE